MNLRFLILRTAVLAVLLAFAFLTAALSQKPSPDAHLKPNLSTPLVLLPLVALPILHALL